MKKYKNGTSFMKKIKLLALAFFVLISMFANNIFAVDLKYEANIAEGASSATIRVFTKPFGLDKDLKETDWIPSGNNFDGTIATYDTYAIGFQGLRNFSSYAGNANSKIHYDSYGGFISAESDAQNQIYNFAVNKVNVGAVANTNFEMYRDCSLTGSFRRVRSRNLKNSNGKIVRAVEFYLDKGMLDEIVKRYMDKDEHKVYENNDRYLRVKFSLPLSIKRNKNQTLATNPIRLPTGSLAVEYINPAYGWHTDSWGSSPGTSVLNYYDNWLYLPLSKLYNRTAYKRYWVKDGNGVYQLVKDIEEKFGSDPKTIVKESIGSNDRFYIGGKISKGSTKAEAERNSKITTNNWGWNNVNGTVNISASNDEEHYIIDYYYDYREMSEYHLKVNGDVINPALNKTAKEFGWPLTRNDFTFRAIIPLYYKYEKWVHVSTEFDHVTSKAKQITVKALDGANKLVFGDKHYAKFFYEFEPPRQVFVRHFVYNKTTKAYERADILTNLNAAIKDGEEEKYYLRKNGYNQRHYKCGESDYVDSITSGFNEQYTIDFSDAIKIDKSRTLENEGTRYIYQGYRIQDKVAPGILTTVGQGNTLDKTKVIAELAPSKVTKTYVDFYYRSANILPPGSDDPDPDNPDNPPEDPDDPRNPDDPNPTIDFVPEDDEGTEIGPDSSNNTGECKITYVPAGENLKSYITTSTYRPYSLIYTGKSIDENTGEIEYKLRKYDAYRFIDGYAQNTGESKYGYFNSTAKRGVFNTDLDTYINPIRATIDDVVRNSISVMEGLNPNEIEKVADGRKTVKTDFGRDNVHKVNSDKYNGVRKPTGKAKYDVTSLVVDETKVFSTKVDVPLVKTRDDTQVNVFTPANLKEPIVKSETVVNHSNQDNFVIQKNTEFEITPQTDKATDYMNIPDTSRYIKYYWMVLDFDVKLTKSETTYDKASATERIANTGEIVRAGNLIQIPVGGSFKGIATNDDDAGDIVNQFSNKLKVVAVVHNVTDKEFEKKIMDKLSAGTMSSYVDKGKISKVTTSCGEESNKQTHNKADVLVGIDVNNMYDDAKYFVESTKVSKNIGRVYDFKITDCLDVNFKNVFRKSENGDVNDLRGIKYFSGLRRLLVYGGNGVQLGANQSNQNNIFDDRINTDTSVNSVVSKTIVPFGPYKHIDQNYAQAPKLGYRISFDLKTSGMYVKGGSTQRYIKITPSYYYISKDGRTFKENIELYYKNSSGRYTNFEGSGYTIYFKPNDGYRTTYNKDAAPELKDMSTKLEALKIGGTKTEKSFIINDSMMSYSDNNFVQAWYGEFKLPNSTIAVEVEDGGKKDINKPLTDGYIGVRFDIQCVDKEVAGASESDTGKTTIISYGVNDKTAAEQGLIYNTTQWDYEGFIGFPISNIGKSLQSGFRLQLEKDFWKISTQEMYEKVKSTVVLFDIDNRAANDFE